MNSEMKPRSDQGGECITKLIKPMSNYAKMLAEARKAGTVKRLTPKYHQWDKKGETLVGAFVSRSSVRSSVSDGNYNQYMIETDEGFVKFALGRAADTELTDLLVPGVVYAFTYEGKEKIKGGKSVNKFDIIEVGGEPIAKDDVEPSAVND